MVSAAATTLSTALSVVGSNHTWDNTLYDASKLLFRIWVVFCVHFMYVCKVSTRCMCVKSVQDAYS